MSFGLTATLLVRLDAHMGLWVSVNDLVKHTATNRHAVLAELETLVANRQARALRHPHTGEIQSAMCQPGNGL